MIIIMTPSSYIISLYLALIAHQDMSTWIATLVTASQQTILLFLILFFILREKFLNYKNQKNKYELNEI
jgi:hypothetical protein